MARLARRAALAATLMSLLAGLGSIAPAAAANVACGQTITVSTTLDANIGPCPNNGIVVGADNIVLNLNGHTITGTQSRGDGAGVLLRGRHGVTVINGTVQAFDGGVAIEGGGGNTVQQVTATGNFGGGGALYGDGIAVESSVNNRIFANDATNNGPFSGIGLYSDNDSDHARTASGTATGNQIDSNNVTGNVAPRPGGSASSTDNDGIRVEPDTTGNTIVHNVASDNGLDGISLFRGSGNNVLKYNDVSHNGYFRTAARRGSGIIVFNLANNNVLESNNVRDNADNGIVVRGPVGSNAGSSGNTIQYNMAFGNAALPTIPSSVFGTAAYDLSDTNPNCDSNTWFGNLYHSANPACTTTGGTQI